MTVAADDARAELDRIVAEMRTPEARDPIYYRLLVSDYTALVMRPEVREDSELLVELLDGLDRLFAARHGITVGLFRELMRADEGCRNTADPQPPRSDPTAVLKGNHNE